MQGPLAQDCPWRLLAPTYPAWPRWATLLCAASWVVLSLRSLTATTRKRKWQWSPGHVGPRQRDPIFASSHSDPYPSPPTPGFSCSPCLSDREPPHPTPTSGLHTWVHSCRGSSHLAALASHPALACGRKRRQGKQGPGVNEASFALFLSFFLKLGFRENKMKTC